MNQQTTAWSQSLSRVALNRHNVSCDLTEVHEIHSLTRCQATLQTLVSSLKQGQTLLLLRKVQSTGSTGLAYTIYPARLQRRMSSDTLSDGPSPSTPAAKHSGWSHDMKQAQPTCLGFSYVICCHKHYRMLDASSVCIQLLHDH